MSKQEMFDMKKDVENLKSKMNNMITESQLNPRSVLSSLENSRVDNFQQSQILKQSNTTTFVPHVSLKSSILASKVFEKDPFQDRNVFQTESFNDINNYPSINKFASKNTMATNRSIEARSNNHMSLKESKLQDSYDQYDKDIAYEKEILDLKSKVTKIEFEKDNLRRNLDRAERRL